MSVRLLYAGSAVFFLIGYLYDNADAISLGIVTFFAAFLWDD